MEGYTAGAGSTSIRLPNHKVIAECDFGVAYLRISCRRGGTSDMMRNPMGQCESLNRTYSASTDATFPPDSTFAGPETLFILELYAHIKVHVVGISTKRLKPLFRVILVRMYHLKCYAQGARTSRCFSRLFHFSTYENASSCT